MTNRYECWAPPTGTLSRRRLLGGAGRALALGMAGPGLAAALAGCSRSRTRERPRLSTDLVRGSLRVALDADIETLDPAMHRSRQVEAVVRNICDGLVTRDAEMRYVPQLAESWRMEGDTRWVFTLREDVEFHNGDSFTAEDVKFTLDRILGKIEGLPPSPRKDLLGPVASVEVVDPHTVAIITEEPYPILHKQLVFQEIVPKAHFEKVGHEAFARHPVGTGPFRFVEWRPGERIVLERFDGYYGGSPDVPPVAPAKLSGVIFRPLEEAATRLASLEAGDVHVVAAVPPHQAQHVDQMANVHLASVQGTRTFFVGANCARPPFSDVRVRQAVRLAMDPEPIVKQFLSGRATAIPGILVPATFGYDATLPAPRRDVRRAKELLKAAGHGDGLEVTFDCDANDKSVAEAVAGTLSAAGIHAKVRVWKSANLLNQLRRGERDLFLTAWGNSSLDPSGILPVLFRSDGYSNFFGYRNPEVDRLLHEAERTLDNAARSRKYVRVQQILHRDVPTCFHYVMEELYGVADAVENFHARADGMLHMHDVGLKSR
ncbi:MAG: ABC transporter substrate-binding protein [Armatimonadetes bacterium]|nr:ABC transporter substrate-binding protein [Armatimonadota bacterium]